MTRNKNVIALSSSLELESEPQDFAAQVLWPVLHPVRRQEHQDRCDEQHSAAFCEHAPEV